MNVGVLLVKAKIHPDAIVKSRKVHLVLNVFDEKVVAKRVYGHRNIFEACTKDVENFKYSLSFSRKAIGQCRTRSHLEMRADFPTCQIWPLRLNSWTMGKEGKG